MQFFLTIEFVVGLLIGFVLSPTSAERKLLRGWSSAIPGDRRE
jgi:hypothetical protein